ncbi:MAG: hypothetical protein J5I93_07065, partial [Pirellulaceae bacterium]|nr:hypothetical protein [Pirellulaceae bacterium]
MSSQPHSLTPVRPGAVDRLLAAALRDPADEALRQLVDSSLMAILFLAPLLMAGDHPWGRLLLVSLVISACGMWAFHQARHRRAEWTRSGAEGVLLAGGALLVLQLLPLPASWLAALSPNLPDLLPLWATETSPVAAPESLAAAAPSAGSGLGSWRQLSLHPEATRTSLVMYATCSALFLLVVQRVRSQQDIERLVRWVAIAALGMALLSMLQAMTRAEGLPWFFEHPRPEAGEGLRGPFASSDQLAHFLALGLGPMIWWSWHLLRPVRRRRLATVPRTESYEPLVRVLLLATFAVLILAGTLTRSHAGFTLWLLSAAICGGVYWFRGLGKLRGAWALLVVASLTAMAAWAYGYEGLMRDVRALGGQQPAAAGDGLESSRLVWQAGM